MEYPKKERKSLVTPNLDLCLEQLVVGEALVQLVLQLLLFRLMLLGRLLEYLDLSLLVCDLLQQCVPLQQQGSGAASHVVGRLS